MLVPAIGMRVLSCMMIATQPKVDSVFEKATHGRNHLKLMQKK
jgi:hypothetical protein